MRATRSWLTLSLLALAGCTAGGALPEETTVAPVGRWPEDVVYDPESDRVFVANEGSATISVLTANVAPVGTLPLATRARHLAVDSRLGHLYAPNEGSGFVSAFGTRDLRERFRVLTGRAPHGIAVDATSHRVFVGNEADASLTAFDGRTGRVLYTVPVGVGPGGVAADPVSGRVLVVSVKEDRVLVLDGATGAPHGSIGVGRGPTHLRVNGATGIAYVLNTEADTVSVIDVRALLLRATIRVGRYPIGIALDEPRRHVWIVNNRANTVSALDDTALIVRAAWRIPNNVSSAAVNGSAGSLYLALKSDNRVAVIPLGAFRGVNSPVASGARRSDTAGPTP